MGERKTDLWRISVFNYLTRERWQPLRPGDGIYIVAPAGKMPNATEVLQCCCDLIADRGFQPVFHSDIFGEENSLLQAACRFAHSDEARCADFMRALDSDCRMIWCFRGGYGSDRVAALLHQKKWLPAGEPKLLAGFSDVTVLHHYLHVQWQWPVLHAPVLSQLAKNSILPAHVTLLWQLLAGEVTECSLPLQPLNAAARKDICFAGSLMGGNLAIIHSGFGTPWEMPRRGILFLEDVNEAPYRVARLLQQWLSAEWLKEVTAVILGEFLEAGRETELMRAVLADFADRATVPVFRCGEVGHGERNHPLLLGSPARGAGGENAVLSVVYHT